MDICIIILGSCPSSACRNSWSSPTCSGWWRCSQLKYIPSLSCTATTNSTKSTELISRTLRTSHNTSITYCTWWVGSSESLMDTHPNQHFLWLPHRMCCYSWRFSFLFLSTHPCPLYSPANQSVSSGWWSSMWRIPSGSPPSLFLLRLRS